MHYLINDIKGVCVTKTDISYIRKNIQNIENQKMMMTGYYNSWSKTERIPVYCTQLLNLLCSDFVDGFHLIESYKENLSNAISRGNTNGYWEAIWRTTEILCNLKCLLYYAIPFDNLPTYNPTNSITFDTLIQNLEQTTKNNTLKILCETLSLAFKITDMANISNVFWYYHTLINRLESSGYDLSSVESNLLQWAKAQRGYFYLAVVHTAIGATGNIMSIITETTAQQDIQNFQPLSFL